MIEGFNLERAWLNQASSVITNLEGVLNTFKRIEIESPVFEQEVIGIIRDIYGVSSLEWCSDHEKIKTKYQDISKKTFSSMLTGDTNILKATIQKLQFQYDLKQFVTYYSAEGLEGTLSNIKNFERDIEKRNYPLSISIDS